MTLNLTPAQREAVLRAALEGGRLVHMPGGHWTTPERRDEAAAGVKTAPTWWCGVRTVRAAERAGALARAGDGPAWVDDRVVTEAGRLAVGADLAERVDVDAPASAPGGAAS